MPKLDIVFGKRTNPQSVAALVNKLSTQDWTGTLYVGYPVFAGDEGSSVTDALLTCKEHGVVIFDMSAEEILELPDADMDIFVKQHQRELRRKLNSRLVGYEDLVTEDGISLSFPIKVLTFLPHAVAGLTLNEVATQENLISKISEFPALEEKYYKPLNAAVQKTAALKPKKKRFNVKKTDSMGAVIKYLESQIANLDRWQKNAAIESPEGPQRIRGLAGSGKTIILALKAAYLHANDPEAEIVVTFNTRSLYQQFKSLIRRFYFDQVSDEPNWEKLKILHAWGSSSSPGLYSTIAAYSGMAAIPFGTARYKYGYNDAFKGVCGELVEHLKKNSPAPLYDYLLIDEAQDFPATFFQLAYWSTKPPKRIVWAYDELQNLGDSTMPSLEELFGRETDGTPVVSLNNFENQPQQDILLPVCYRNPPWLLTAALGVGLGTKLGNGRFAQMFRNPDFWREIGYDIVSGDLGLGQHVRLRRNPERSADFFSNVLTPNDSISCHSFIDNAHQSEWIARDIVRVATTQELDLNDILIVIPDSLSASKIGMQITSHLAAHGIKSHLIGVTGSQDLVFVENSVAICSIYRAKGNEAPLVYIANAEYCSDGIDLSKKRNILFTALTRAKAWVRVCGIGERMNALTAEIGAIASDNYDLDFIYPTQQQLDQLRSAYRELTSKEKRDVKKEIKSAQKLLQRLIEGELNIDDLPPDLAERLRKAL